MGWSLNNWGSSRVEAASEFLRTGVVGTSFGGTGCFGSNQCAVGYACIGGRCVKTDEAGGGSGGSYSGSSNGAGGYYPGGSCGSGTDGSVSGDGSIGTGSCATSSSSSGGPVGCTVPTCGEGSNGYGGFDSDCCGTRCCRYQAGVGGVPTVNCYCGNCPGFTGDPCSSDADCASGVCINGRCADPKRCVSFCYEYYEANGDFAAGCSSDDVCDECTECGGSSSSGDYCTQKADAPPCHCDPGSVGDCDLCADDGSVIPGVCLECATISNYDCNCGVSLNVTVCQPQGTSGLSIVNKAQDAAKAACKEECSQSTSEPDKCAPSIATKTVCAPGTCGDPGSGLPANEDGKNNVWTGCIEANGEACVLYTEEDYSDLPDECKGCDCNCHNDCPSCQLCGADGTCYPDPACEGDHQTTWAIDIPGYSVCTIAADCGVANCTEVPPVTQQKGTTACGQLPHTLQTVQSCFYVLGTGIVNGNCPYVSTSPSQGFEVQVARYEVVDGNGRVILRFDGNNPVGWGGGAHPDTTEPGCQVPYIVETIKCS